MIADGNRAGKGIGTVVYRVGFDLRSQVEVAVDYGLPRRRDRGSAAARGSSGATASGAWRDVPEANLFRQTGSAF